MEPLRPRNVEELADVLKQASTSRKRIHLIGNNSKSRLGGQVTGAGVCLSTSSLDSVHQFEPRDLTVSVGAGLLWTRFCDLLDQHGMMVPLDPPFASQATVGGVVAANSSGPRRRLYGTARDVVIGMTFVTVEGAAVQSGGMVVKNVAGLDMAKLMIGSMGTLAVIASVNFKLIPKPQGTRTFVYECDSLKEAMSIRNRVLRGVLQPSAIDILNPAAAAMTGHNAWVIAIGTAGNVAVLDRYHAEFAAARTLTGEAEYRFWHDVQELVPRFLGAHEHGSITRVPATLNGIEQVLAASTEPALARAGNGVVYLCSSEAETPSYPKAVMEYGPVSRNGNLNMWPSKNSSFPIMQRIKKMFDPDALLNPGRYYGNL